MRISGHEIIEKTVEAPQVLQGNHVGKREKLILKNRLTTPKEAVYEYE
jgi:hypothetical protein